MTLQDLHIYSLFISKTKPQPSKPNRKTLKANKQKVPSPTISVTFNMFISQKKKRIALSQYSLSIVAFYISKIFSHNMALPLEKIFFERVEEDERVKLASQITLTLFFHLLLGLIYENIMQNSSKQPFFFLQLSL